MPGNVCEYVATGRHLDGAFLVAVFYYSLFDVLENSQAALLRTTIPTTELH
jgi:hypothetical protein